MLFDDKLSDIIRTLETDGVLLHPTDTVWGLACSAHSRKAIEKILRLKKMDQKDGFTLLMDSLEMLKKHVPHIHPRIETLLHFHKKPLTVIYPKVKNIPSFARNMDNSAAIRIILDPYCNEIIKLLGNPLIFTPAHFIGDLPPKSFNEISKSIIEHVDFISKHRRKEYIKEQQSVMIDYNEEGEINFLRL